jgi:hypothetical protein
METIITQMENGEVVRTRRTNSGGVWIDTPSDQAMCRTEKDGNTFYWVGMGRLGMTTIHHAVREMRRANVQARWDARCARHKTQRIR